MRRLTTTNAGGLAALIDVKAHFTGEWFVT